MFIFLHISPYLSLSITIWQLQHWTVPPPEEGDNGPEQGLWQGDQGEGQLGKEVWGLILCKVPSGMVHMRECFHCPPPELFVEFVENSAKTTTGAFIVPLPGLVVSFGLARWHCQTNKIAPEVRGARDADGGDGGNDGSDGSHCPPPGWVHFLLPNPNKPFFCNCHVYDRIQCVSGNKLPLMWAH